MAGRRFTATVPGELHLTAANSKRSTEGEEKPVNVNLDDVPDWARPLLEEGGPMRKASEAPAWAEKLMDRLDRLEDDLEIEAADNRAEPAFMDPVPHYRDDDPGEGKVVNRGDRAYMEPTPHHES